jgi:SAM-dependent methyltransferase
MRDVSNEYISLRLAAGNLDRYYVRTSIERQIRRSLEFLRGTLLDVGCGYSPYKALLISPPGRVTRYVGMDIACDYYKAAPDLQWDGRRIPLAEESIDSALLTEVLEHCPDATAVLREVNRVLKPGGFVLATVPFLWPLHDVPYDEYRYTPFSLERHFREGGFVRIEVTALGGWDAALASMIGLWVNRRPMRYGVRRILQKIALPVCRRLISTDTQPPDFTQSEMITGLAVTARKPGPPEPN